MIHRYSNLLKVGPVKSIYSEVISWPMYCERITPFEATNHPGALPSNPLTGIGSTIGDDMDRPILMDTTEHALCWRGNISWEQLQLMAMLWGPNKQRPMGNYPFNRQPTQQYRQMDTNGSLNEPGLARNRFQCSMDILLPVHLAITTYLDAITTVPAYYIELEQADGENHNWITQITGTFIGIHKTRYFSQGLFDDYPNNND